MTTAADDRAVERAFEASLAGRPVPEEAGLAVFAEAVRGAASQPGRPNAALAELLATGLLIDQSSPAVRTAGPQGSPGGSPARTRRRRVILPALIAKFLSAGAVAQAATGAGIAVVVVAGAGAAGVLPDRVQQTFSAVVGAEGGTATTEPTEAARPTEVVVPAVVAEPTEIAEPTEVVDPTVVAQEPDQTEIAEPSAADPTGAVPVGVDAEPASLPQGTNFGARVSADARDGGVDGQKISAEARAKKEQRKARKTAAAEEPSATEQPADEADEDTGRSAEAGADTAAGDGGGDAGSSGDDGSGRGDGKGNGKAKGGDDD